MVGALFFLSTSGDGGVTFRFDPGVDIFGWFVDPKFVSRAQSSPRMASRSCSRVSSRLIVAGEIVAKNKNKNNINRSKIAYYANEGKS